MSKIDDIDNLNVKAKELDEEFHRMKDSLTSTNTSVEELDAEMVDLRNRLQNSNIDLRNRMENLERYSRDFNIRVIGVIEEEGEDCMAIVLNILTLLGFEDASGEIENAHRTGKKGDDKPRHIIVNLYSRPFKRSLLRVAKKKKKQKKKDTLSGIRLVEDFIPGDFELRKKALPLMKKFFEEGKRVRFTKGKLLVDGKEIPVE